MFQTELIPPARQMPPADVQPESIAVDIYDQVYHLRGIDPAYIDHLASIVDTKMRAVSAHGTVDSLRVAVLASLNIADELEVMRERYNVLVASTAQSQAQAQTQNAMRSRSATLSQMLDQVFDECEQLPVRRVG